MIDEVVDGDQAPVRVQVDLHVVRSPGYEVRGDADADLADHQRRVGAVGLVYALIGKSGLDVVMQRG